MSNHLRFTLDELQALRLACRTLSLIGSYTAFQRTLAKALRSSDPLLARQISRLGKARVRTLRMHMESQQSNLPADAQATPRCDLSIREWQAVSQACALLWLSDDCPRSFQDRLVGEVEETEPALAEKLGRLDPGQAASLYRRVKTGKRWCAY